MVPQQVHSRKRWREVVSADNQPMGSFAPGSVTAIFPDGNACTAFFENPQRCVDAARLLNARRAELFPDCPYVVDVDSTEGRLFIRLYEPDVDERIVRLLRSVPPEMLCSPHLRLYAPKRTLVLWMKQEFGKPHNRGMWMLPTGFPKALYAIPVVVQDAPDNVLLTLTAPGFGLFDAKVAPGEVVDAR